MSALAKRNSVTESEWLAINGLSFGDDQQAMLYAQLGDILKGNLDMEITDEHIEAYQQESKPLHEFLECF